MGREGGSKGERGREGVRGRVRGREGGRDKRYLHEERGAEEYVIYLSSSTIGACDRSM